MEEAKSYEWHKIAESLEEIDFAANGMAEVKVNGKDVCVIRANNAVSACAQKCPHAGGILSKGYIDAVGNIVCPLHRYKFSVKNGRNISGEGYFLKTYPVELRENGVFIGFIKNNLLNWLK